jgi:hypothetical protein
VIALRWRPRAGEGRRREAGDEERRDGIRQAFERNVIATAIVNPWLKAAAVP